MDSNIPADRLSQISTLWTGLARRDDVQADESRAAAAAFLDRYYQAVFPIVTVAAANEGNDTLLGGAGNDLIYGNGGQDRIDGGLLRDFVYGGKGNDVLLNTGDGFAGVVPPQGCEMSAAAITLRFVGAAITDGELVARFVRHRDGAAFAAIQDRHGPMVLRVCRRLLGDQHAAEGAYQATFLLFVQKAAAFRHPDAVGPWLYGAATRAASRLS